MNKLRERTLAKKEYSYFEQSTILEEVISQFGDSGICMELLRYMDRHYPFFYRQNELGYFSADFLKNILEENLSAWDFEVDVLKDKQIKSLHSTIDRDYEIYKSAYKEVFEFTEKSDYVFFELDKKSPEELSQIEIDAIIEKFIEVSRVEFALSFDYLEWFQRHDFMADHIKRVAHEIELQSVNYIEEGYEWLKKHYGGSEILRKVIEIAERVSPDFHNNKELGKYALNFLQHWVLEITNYNLDIDDVRIVEEMLVHYEEMKTNYAKIFDELVKRQYAKGGIDVSYNDYKRLELEKSELNARTLKLDFNMKSSDYFCLHKEIAEYVIENQAYVSFMEEHGGSSQLKKLLKVVKEISPDFAKHRELGDWSMEFLEYWLGQMEDNEDLVDDEEILKEIRLDYQTKKSDYQHIINVFLFRHYDSEELERNFDEIQERELDKLAYDFEVDV